MKDLGEASYIPGIRIYRDRSKRMLGLSQSRYIDLVLKRFNMEASKRGYLPMSQGIRLSKKISPKTQEKRENELYPLCFSRGIYNVCHAMYQA